VGGGGKGGLPRIGRSRNKTGQGIERKRGEGSSRAGRTTLEKDEWEDTQIAQLSTRRKGKSNIGRSAKLAIEEGKSERRGTLPKTCYRALLAVRKSSKAVSHKTKRFAREFRGKNPLICSYRDVRTRLQESLGDDNKTGSNRILPLPYHERDPGAECPKTFKPARTG